MLVFFVWRFLGLSWEVVCSYCVNGVKPGFVSKGGLTHSLLVSPTNDNDNGSLRMLAFVVSFLCIAGIHS